MMTAQQPAFSHAPTRPKLLFADDHHLVLDALAFMAGSEYEVQGVDSSAGFEAAVDQFSPDLGILDVRMPDGSGFEVARRVLKKRPDLKLMFLSMHTELKFVREAMEIGAKGYLSKRASAEELMLAIRTVLAGGTYVGPRPQNGEETESPEENVLTERQTEVLRLISQGCSAKEIANRLNISVRTAEFHRAAIMDRLKLHSTAMMTRYAVERGLA
ncbi:MAG TPA: response regulator transcription factor [Bryobacteraceae bacterium]|nr:response regulator transcription factor [Bryobacteraceae bacterium]